MGINLTTHTKKLFTEMFVITIRKCVKCAMLTKNQTNDI